MGTKLDWHSAPINLSTTIDKNYKMTQNVRRFFKAHLGDNFHFNRSFMLWMKTNIDKTMAEALEEFKKRSVQG